MFVQMKLRTFQMKCLIELINEMKEKFDNHRPIGFDNKRR
jgi:hypothetical protein